MAHSTLGPSKAKQWINCPGSIALCEKAPPQAPNFAATEGTVAHSIAEKFVTGKIDSLEMMAMIGTTVMEDGMEIEIIEEMFDGAVEYKELIDADRKMLAATPGVMPVQGHAEVRVHAKSVDDRVWGTSDYILYKKGKKLIVYDYKFGQGVIVDPEENEQAALYLLGAMETVAGAAFDELEVVIHQPRGRHADGPVRRWTASKEWLENFRLNAKMAAAETLRANARIVAGDWCRWCTAKPFCPVVHKAAQESAMVTFSAVAPEIVKAADKLQEVRLLPIEQLGKMLEWEGAVKALFESVKDVVRERLSQGLPVPGWKLVTGREGNREWVSEDAVVAEFGPSLGTDALFVKKILSPAALEKLVGKKHKIDHLVTRAPGEKAIAKDKDPRPAVASAAQDAFSVMPMADISGGLGQLTGVRAHVTPTAPLPVTVKVVDCLDCELGGCPTHKAAEDDILGQLGAAPAKREPMWPV